MENLVTLVGCMVSISFGVFITLYIQGKITPLTISKAQAPTQADPAVSLKKAEEIAEQWDNLLNYTGKIRGEDFE